MSKLPVSPFWSRNPQIQQKHLDTSNKHVQTCPTYDFNSRDHPIHCITTASPAPPSYRSTTSPATSSGHLAAPPSFYSTASPAASSGNLVVPILRIETPRRWYRPQPPRPALRFDVQPNEQGRARVRARRVTFSPISPVTTIHEDHSGRRSFTSGSSIPNTPVDDDEPRKKSNLGLGIAEAPFHSDPSPIQSPGGERLDKAEKGEPIKQTSTPDLAGGIEQRLWKYSASNDVVKRWRLEIISWLLSASCMSAIIVLLFLLQDKPFPKRWPLDITLNGWIGILSRIASASIVFPVSKALGQLKWSRFQGRSKKMLDFEMFDNASRGAWGSLVLLVRTKGTTLAALGAAITIFVMAMDMFFQQLVRYPQVSVAQSQNSSIPRVIHYEPHFTKVLVNNKTEIINPDLDISATIDKFFFGFGTQQFEVGNSTRAEIPLSCPTSDCTWEPYETLGVCSECINVADMLEFGCITGFLDWVSNSTSFVFPNFGPTCGWFFNATSERPILMQGYEADPSTNELSGEILTTRLLPLISNIKKIPMFGGSINFKHVRNPLANFVVASTTEGPDQESVLRSIFQHQKPRTLECILSWCVKTIESSYHSGTYTEIVKDSFINTTAGPWPWTFIAPDSDNPEDTAKVQYMQDITVDPHSHNGQGNVSSYGASNQTAFNILAIFDDYLPSTATLANNASEPKMRYLTREREPFTRQFPNNPWSAPNNITHHMERFATAMTNIMRQSSKHSALGKAYGQETYIEVRWAWLTLPLALLVSTMIFLLVTVIRSSVEKERIGVWKNSAIATLLYGVGDALKQKITTSEGHGTPRSKAKELNARMLPTKDWRISGLSPILRTSKPPPGWI